MIIIPTYNERKNIRQLVGRIRAVLPQISVLFVDDNSPDGTSEEIKTLQVEDKNIHLLTRPGKNGFASAYLDGFRYVLQNFQPEFVVTMDADLSHPPEKLPELIGAAGSGKVAIGSRYVPGGSVKNWSLKRKILSRFGNLYARTMTRLPIKDLTGGFIAMPIERLKQLDLGLMESRGYAFLMELKLKLSGVGSEFIEVPITFEERREGESKIGGNIIAEGVNYPARVWGVRQIQTNGLAWLIFFVSLGVYVATLPRTIFFGDSPEFMASAATLGIPHSPGYPLYVLIGKVFTFLPFGNLEFRIGLFSALSGSLALVVFYFLFIKIIPNKWIGFISALILGFSDMFWSQAIMAKVYMPLLLVTLLILLMFVKYWETKKTKYLLGSLLFFGLGSGLHQIVFLFLPLLLFAIWVAIPNIFRHRFRLKTIITGGILFALGLAVYIFLPIRYHMSGNFYNFPQLFDASRPGNWSGFIHYFQRSDYADYGGSILWKDKFIFLYSAFQVLFKQFSWTLLLIPIGFWELIKRKRILALTLGVFLLNILGIILFRSGKWNYENDVMYSFYYLPAYTMAMFWIASGLYYLFMRAENLIPKNLRSGLYVVTLVLPLVFFGQNFKTNNLQHFEFVDTYTKSILESLPPNSVLLVNYPGANTDTVTFGFYFQQTVKHLRPDVSILTIYQMYPNVDRKILTMIYELNDPIKSRYQLTKYAMKYFSGRPIYTTYLVDDLGSSWSEASNGLVYRFYENPAEVKAEPEHYELNYQKDLAILKENMYGQDILAQYFYTQGGFWVTNKNLAKAQENFIDAIKYDYKPLGIDQKAFIFYRNRIFGKL